MRKMFGGKTQDSDGNDNKTTTNKVVTQEYRNALNKGLEYAKGTTYVKKGNIRTINVSLWRTIPG